MPEFTPCCVTGRQSRSRPIPADDQRGTGDFQCGKLVESSRQEIAKTVPAFRLIEMMNQLLKTIDITRNSDSFEEIVSRKEAEIHIIGIDSDLFFTANENKETFEELKKTG